MIIMSQRSPLPSSPLPGERDEGHPQQAMLAEFQVKNQRPGEDDSHSLRDAVLKFIEERRESDYRNARNAYRRFERR